MVQSMASMVRLKNILRFMYLPDKYILKNEAEQLSWLSSLGNLSDIAPGKTIGGGIYRNREGKLPAAPGRIWFEADINYISGHRNTHRLLYSSDGVIFVTYDHYMTFSEIII